MDATSLASAELLLWKALDAHGVDAGALFERAGVDPAKMQDPDARYSGPEALRLWELAVEAAKDPCLGLSLVRYWHPSSLHALGFAWMASASVKDALERLVRYFRILTNAEELSLEETDEAYRLWFIDPGRHPRAPDAAYDALMAVVVEMCRSIYGPEFHPLRVTMKRVEPSCIGDFFGAFRAPIEFSAPEDMLFFAKDHVKMPLPTANADMARASERIIAEYLAHVDRAAIAMRVRAKVIDRLPSGHVSEESVAEALNLSQRTLQRKLKEEGTTYKQLLEEIRRELAAQYMRESRLSINEITYLLGFSEPSNFSRAFKRWTGASPREYRESM